MEDIARYVEAHYRDESRGEDAGWKPQGSLFSYKELEKVGLAAPQVTYVMHDLKERGFDVSPDATTIGRGGRMRS